MVNFSDSIFFRLSKLAWSVISPDSLLLILILLSWVLLKRGAYRPAKWLLGFVAITLIVIALFPVGEWLFYPLETRFPANPELPERVDGIIVLGGAEKALQSSGWDQVELGEDAERKIAFMMLARRYPDAKLVFTGGSGSMLNQEHKGADVAKRLFIEQGLDISRVIFERNSRNTYENVVISKTQIKPDPEETWILITSAFHMPRSVGIFCMAGWPMIPYPVDHRSRPDNFMRIDPDLSHNLGNLKMSIREWVGLTAYFVTGKTASLFPDRCD